jgi:hypothetical protein
MELGISDLIETNVTLKCVFPSARYYDGTNIEPWYNLSNVIVGSGTVSNMATLMSGFQSVSDANATAWIPVVFRDFLEEQKPPPTLARKQGELVCHMRVIAQDD